MELDNAILHDLGSLGQEFFKMAMEELRSFVWETENIPKWMWLSVVINTVYAMFVHFTIYNKKHNP